MGQIITAIVSLILAIILLIKNIETGIGLFAAAIFMVLGISLIIDFHTGIPKAIDVYQGKTTLQITYEDGVPVDSVVVFKR